MREVIERDLRMPEFRDAKPEDLEFREDGKLVRKDRWETGLRSIASSLGWARKEYEIPEVVEKVRGMTRFVWCCENGCGPCDVKRIEFEYERVEEIDGTLVSSKTIPRLVSKCCGADLSMWDDHHDEQIDVATERMPIPASDRPEAESPRQVEQRSDSAEPPHCEPRSSGALPGEQEGCTESDRGEPAPAQALEKN